ncbi:MAG: glycogen debranching N-terminal domain-containing protein [Pseudomonadota bacterium]|uniref:amylo-alpha-1,6-glucosidase n=1 Tax=Thermithiobacillus tepidarius TaxID=929 RepID=UPI0003FD57F5|nr:glycogen debranching N-terminal domain-containing protein [Thermithiobacillus tepidarius]
MNGGARIPQPILVLHGGGVALACALDGQIQAGELHGLFAGDTRVLSTYRLGVGGQAWRLLGRSRSGHATAQWEFQNPHIRDPGGDLPAGTLLLSLRRRLDGVLHDDYAIRAFGDRAVRVRLTIQMDADFADIFEVKNRSIPPRLNVNRMPAEHGVILDYVRGGFRRGLRLDLHPGAGVPAFVGSLIVFELDLAPGGTWTCCLEAAPILDGVTLALAGDPHAPEPNPVPDPQRLRIRSVPLLARPFERGRADLHALAIPQDDDTPYVATGAPWFLTLFGRDSLVTALMAGVDGAWSAAGALAALGRHQGRRRDDFRDEEPGKLPHELRRDELTRQGRLPYSPYYGTHDAPALYCLALWHAWRWSGERRLLDRHFDHARRALRWCDELGDRDGDGLQEYATRSPQGYRNQGWKDAGDAIVHADGRLAEPPLATVELQGYLFAARLAMAELLDALGEDSEAARQRDAATRLRTQVEERFWMAEAGFYALALDRDKRLVAGIASNAGHLLWCGLPASARAAAVARRLLAPDLFSGWGLRTLSADNSAYNPLLYQRGSVWPHDTALAAAGLWRYGFREEAGILLKAILEAATAFEDDRLPELFCGLDRSHGLPVPYEEANSPQAWAAAAPLLAAQLFLGLVPDAPRRRCHLDPWLPDWLPRLELRGIAVGAGKVDVAVRREGGETVIEALESAQVEIVRGSVAAPLWGTPPA